MPSNTPRLRYQTAHRAHQDRNYPATVRDFGYLKTTFPDTRKANGLTKFIINFLTWSGHRATRIAASGRLVDRPQTQASGVSLMTKKWIPGSTRKGSADISSTIKIRSGIGVSVMWEIKIGSDKPSEYQLREQALEQQAGGYYFFIKTPEDFFAEYDKILSL